MQLHRSLNDKFIGGVCGGLAESLGVEAVYLRLAFLLFLIYAGNGLLVYLILWVVLPQMAHAGVPTKLYRRRNDQLLAGVCSGLAVTLGIDPALIRLAFAGLTLVGGGGIVIYLLLWIVMPLEP